ncbi:Uncharacterised protein [Vibrio cholerae]|nr:Uncharacterised protein [Vibrio cholerae]
MIKQMHFDVQLRILLAKLLQSRQHMQGAKRLR